MDNVISFVVVNYNNSSYTKALCESLSKQDGFGVYFNVKCLVIDNSNDKEDSKKLSDYCENIKWIEIMTCPDNPGYFGGLNRGLLGVKDSKYVVVGNNDLEFNADFCNKLISKTYKPNQLVICPDVITSDGVHQNPHVLKRTNWLRRLKFDLYFSNYWVATFLSRTANLLHNRETINNNFKNASEISMGVGACYILSSYFFENYKQLFFPWFLYGEEACLAWQVRDAGGVIWYDPDLVVTHAENVSCSLLPSRAAYNFGRDAYWGYRHLL